MAVQLPEVTLCCIDTAQPAVALRAIEQSRRQCEFARCLFLTHELVEAEGVDVRLIPRLPSAQAYSELVMKGLVSLIQTPFVLLIQWDGYVLNGESWNRDFLNLDYIGAPWPWRSEDLAVGNGGFSLRSRKLLEMLAGPEFGVTHPEDDAICRVYRPMLEKRGIVFADSGTAARFSFERAPPARSTFGFHALYNMWRVLPPGELGPFLDLLPLATLDTVEAIELLASCAENKQWDRALEVLICLERRFDVSNLTERLDRIVHGPIRGKLLHHTIHVLGRVNQQGVKGQ